MRRLAPRELFYERSANEFDDVMHPSEVSRRLEIVFDEALGGRDLDGLTLLDAGCGTGLFSAAAASRGAAVTSMDVGPGLLERVAQKCESRRVVGDVLALPFEDGAFDVVVCTEVIEHTPEPRHAIAELVRVLKQGGTLVLTTPNRVWLPLVMLAGRIGLRPYHGLEKWLSFRQLRRAVLDQRLSSFQHRGFHAVPVRNAYVQRLLAVLDRAGHSPTGRFALNQLVVGKK